MNTSARLRRLCAVLQQSKLDALLVSNPADVRYLSGFTGSSAAMLVCTGNGRRSTRLFTDGRYTAQAREEVQGSTIRITKRPVLLEAATAAAKSGCESCAVDAGATTLAMLDILRSGAVEAGLSKRETGRFFKPVRDLVSSLRMIKDPDEIGSMRRAANLTSTLYESMLSYIDAGMREIDVAAELEHRARLAGAESMSFETIVASGERSSLPHGRATERLLRAGELVTLDFGIILDGYCSDMTRTVFLSSGGRQLSRPARQNQSEMRRVFEAVLEAQMHAVEITKPGATCEQVDAGARSKLKSAGLGEAFSHSTGHGLGLEIHEGPRLAAKQVQALRPGMIVTIEPGAYLPGSFGVRIEDTVLVTETGTEVLTPAFKGWTEL